jgi:hypothetical protein
MKATLYRLLVACDGAVSGHDQWLALGQESGYTGDSDLAGFFGGRAPSMVRLPDDRRVLTEAGWRRARAAQLD